MQGVQAALLKAVQAEENKLFKNLYLLGIFLYTRKISFIVYKKRILHDGTSFDVRWCSATLFIVYKNVASETEICDCFVGCVLIFYVLHFAETFFKISNIYNYISFKI